MLGRYLLVSLLTAVGAIPIIFIAFTTGHPLWLALLLVYVLVLGHIGGFYVFYGWGTTEEQRRPGGRIPWFRRSCITIHGFWTALLVPATGVSIFVAGKGDGAPLLDQLLASPITSLFLAMWVIGIIIAGIGGLALVALSKKAPCIYLAGGFICGLTIVLANLVEAADWDRLALYGVHAAIAGGVILFASGSFVYRVGGDLR